MPRAAAIFYDVHQAESSLQSPTRQQIEQISPTRHATSSMMKLLRYKALTNPGIRTSRHDSIGCLLHLLLSTQCRLAWLLRCLPGCLGGCLAARLAARLVAWLAGWLAARLAARLAGWLAGCLASCLAGWLAGWMQVEQTSVAANTKIKDRSGCRWHKLLLPQTQKSKIDLDASATN